MKLTEYEAKKRFKAAGIPLPEGILVSSSNEAVTAAEAIGYPVAIKAQILTGGRGKAGGIKFANDSAQTRRITEELLGSVLKGYSVQTLMIEKQCEIKQELYLGITIDREARRFMVIASATGGMDIEDVARSDPSAIIKQPIDPLDGLTRHLANNTIRMMAITEPLLTSMTEILVRLWRVMVENDAELAEINPLIITPAQKILALDAKLVIDDNALSRHKDLLAMQEKETSSSDREQKAKKAGMSYVELEGDIGIIGNGAGLVMSTMDTIHLYGGSPANFLDVGGGASAEQMETAVRIIRENPRVKAIFVNIMGGITRCDEIAKGLLEGIQESPDLKLVVRMVGTHEHEGRAILNQAGINVYDLMDGAAEAAVNLVRG